MRRKCKIKKKKPNFIIAGAPKCGTTSLYYYLKQHPEVFMPEQKEPSYFYSDFNKIKKRRQNHLQKLSDITAKNHSEYLKHFKKAKNETAIGEATPWYFTSREDAKNMFSFNPEIKIILILRNPVDLLYSMHSQLIYKKIEDEKNFEKALKLEKQRRKFRKLPKYAMIPNYLFYSEHAKFEKHIKKYLKFFPKEQILILTIEDLKNNIEKTYKRICNFLEIKTNFKPDFTIINENKIARIKILQNPILIGIGEKICPLRLRGFISKFFKKVNNKYIKRPKLNKNLRKKLMQKFKPEVEKTSKLINRDLIDLWDFNKID